jgi:hypothetical protein
MAVFGMKAGALFVQVREGPLYGRDDTPPSVPGNGVCPALVFSSTFLQAFYFPVGMRRMTQQLSEQRNLPWMSSPENAGRKASGSAEALAPHCKRPSRVSLKP